MLLRAACAVYSHPLPCSRLTPSSSSSTGSSLATFSSSCTPHRLSGSGPSPASSSSSTRSAPSQLAFPSHLPNPGPYEIFHLPRSASQVDVKARYYDLVKLLHPDRRPALHHTNGEKQTSSVKEKEKGTDPSPQETIVDEFRKVVKAYEILSDARRRSAFDRYGLGWNEGSSSTASSSSFYPTPEELHELQRRRAFTTSTSPYDDFWHGDGGPYQTGWQREAGSSRGAWDSSASFYQFNMGSNAFRGGRDSSSGPLYTSNRRFFAVVAMLTWSLALLQFHRVGLQSDEASVHADRKHLDAAESLEEARRKARSLEGRKRYDALRTRAREMRVLEQVERLEKRGQEQAQGQNFEQNLDLLHSLSPPPPPSTMSQGYVQTEKL